MTTGLKIALAAGFWLSVALLQALNWQGQWKALILLVLLGGAAALFAARRGDAQRIPPRWLAALALVLLVAQLAYLGTRLGHPRLIDMATTTLAAGDTIAAGGNPYTQPIDGEAGGLGAVPGFRGYKYLPVMAAVYWPLGHAFGERGVPVTNLVLEFAVVALLWRLGGTTGALAAALYLSLPIVAQQLFAKGSTDLAAVVPLLLGLLLVNRNGFAAGLCVGLSIAAKLFPGALFLPVLLPEGGAARRRYALGVAIGLLPILPFAVAAPRALLDNIVLFNAIRPPDSTSWLFFAPPLAATAARAALAGLFLAAAILAWRRPLELPARAALGALLIIAALLAGPAAHHNYMLWWLPFFALALAAFLERRVGGLPKPFPAL
ncbi:MAG TPA: hypothetical protein VFC38_02115 [Stellaceae bacterium]|nr:hypothetical protein [Stellaceae bacterium]